MTSAPIGDRSTPLDSSSCVTCMLPITSAPQRAPTAAPHSRGRFQVSTYHGNHRRRPPENTVSLVHAHCHGSQGPTHSATHTPTADEVYGSDIGVESSSRPIALAPGSLSVVDGQPMQIDFSGGSGESSRNSSRRRSTQKSTAQDWFNSFNREVGGNGTYDSTLLSLSHVRGCVFFFFSFRGVSGLSLTKSFDLDDPPYYMSNHRRRKHPQASRNSRSLKSQHGVTAESSDQQCFGVRVGSTEGSNNSDSFRSVIDDLTIKSMHRSQLRR
jgi:hypothetical protein